MGLFDTVTNAASTPIVPQDRFVFECSEISEQPPYAPPGEAPKPGARPGIRWTFKLYFASTGEPFYFQDDHYEMYQSTTANMQRGARAREYAEALLGRELGEGEQINPSDLLGKRGVGMVIWELSRNDKTKKVAKLVAPEPIREPARAAASSQSRGGTAVAERPSSGSVDAAREALHKKIRQAEVLQSPNHLEWLALNVDSMDADDCASFMADVQADIDA